MFKKVTWSSESQLKPSIKMRNKELKFILKCDTNYNLIIVIKLNNFVYKSG